MRVLVTGGCGFVGAAVVRLAVERGDHVLNIDRRRRSNPVPALSPIATREGHARLEANVCDRALMRAVVREFAPDAIIHLAATPEADADTLVEGDLGAAHAIIEAARHYRDGLKGEALDRFRIVHLEQAEPDMPGPLTPTQASRGAASALIDRWSRAWGLPLVACAAGEAFGPWQAQTSFMARLLASLLNDQPFVIGNAGENVRDWLPIRDLAHGLLLAAGAPSAPAHLDFSVGAERRDIDVAESVCALMDERAPRARGPWLDQVNCEGDASSALLGPMLDATDAEQALGWRPHGFHTGLDRLLTWALASRAAARARALPVAAE